MKISSRLILLVLASALCLGTLLWYSHHKSKAGRASGNEPSANLDSITAERQRFVESNPVARQSNANGDSVSPPATEAEAEKQYDQQMSEDLQNKNVPIQFWGKTVDQDGQPLSGVKVVAHARTWMTLETGISMSSTQTAISGGDGSFEITGLKGDVLTVDALEKEGYEAEPGAFHGFGYNTSERFKPDSSAPVIFRMWRTNVHEKLIAEKKSFPIVPDGRKYSIDLVNGSIAESGKGDILVWVKRPSDVTLGQKFDWTCEIKVTNGGLLQEPDVNSAMYLAPTEGYEPVFQFEQKVGSGWGDSTGPKRFYIQINGGKTYGRMVIQLYAYYNDSTPGLVRVEYAVNPSGSRTLR